MNEKDYKVLLADPHQVNCPTCRTVPSEQWVRVSYGHVMIQTRRGLAAACSADGGYAQ